MLQLERHLSDRYPHWFRGRRARIARPLLRTVARWSRLDQVEAFLAFGVDPGFSDSVDGLVEVDLQRMHPRKRRRYLEGAAPAEATA